MAIGSSAIVIAIAIVITIIISIAIGKKTKEKLEDCNRLRVEVIDSGRPGICMGLIGGVHGNEPAGAVALNHFLDNPPKLKKGKLVIIPEANRCGLLNGTRLQTVHGGPFAHNKDLNRNFTENGGIDSKSQQITEVLKNCDLVVDIHEGWGYHKIQPGSLGSTLSPVNKQKSVWLADRAVWKINRTISDADKEFTVLMNRACDIPNTLNCHMAVQGKDYILIEITGQRNIQTIETRRDQALFLLNSILEDTEMI